jgi:hypothetical protein
MNQLEIMALLSAASLENVNFSTDVERGSCCAQIAFQWCHGEEFGYKTPRRPGYVSRLRAFGIRPEKKDTIIDDVCFFAAGVQKVSRFHP